MKNDFSKNNEHAASKTEILNMPKVSVIVLNYNGMTFVDRCLKSVLNSEYPDFDVIFVDNKSFDGSVEHVQKNFGSNPNLKIVINDKNYGFALGNNIGTTYAKGDYFVFLNIDTVVKSDWLQKLVNTMEANPSIGAAQCKLLLMDNPELFDSVGHYIDWFGISFVIGHKQKDHGQYERVHKIFGATGAALAVRKDVFERIKGFDNDFFMLFEEDDLCWRIWLTGYAVVYVPDAIVFHKSGGLRTKEGNYMNLYLTRRNRIISILKNYEAPNVLRFLPINLSMLFMIAFFTKNKLEYLKAFCNSVIWVMCNAKKVMLKRYMTQAVRVVPDKKLMTMGIIKKPNLRQILREGY